MALELDTVFLDTNVVLDHLADRLPFSESAHRIFALAEGQKLKLHVSALSFCNLYYILRKVRGHDQAVVLLAKLALLVEIALVGDREIRAALASGWRDFEDSVQYESAGGAADIAVLVTRNSRDFSGRHLRVQSPEEYILSRQVRGI